MNANEKFKKGDSVRLTERGRNDRFAPKIQTGVVTGFYKYPLTMVMVREDGKKKARTWHMDFWEKLGEMK